MARHLSNPRRPANGARRGNERWRLRRRATGFSAPCPLRRGHRWLAPLCLTRRPMPGCSVPSRPLAGSPGSIMQASTPDPLTSPLQRGCRSMGRHRQPTLRASPTVGQRTSRRSKPEVASVNCTINSCRSPRHLRPPAPARSLRPPNGKVAHPCCSSIQNPMPIKATVHRPRRRRCLRWQQSSLP